MTDTLHCNKILFMPSVVSRALYIGRVFPGNMQGKGEGFSFRVFFSLNAIKKKKIGKGKKQDRDFAEV